jgi:hypothetical protein
MMRIFREYDRYDDGMWGLVLWEPVPGTYTVEAGVERRQSRRWPIVEFKGLVDATAARRVLMPWQAGAGSSINPAASEPSTGVRGHA